MPRGDGRGPIGMGPKSGLVMGFCAGFTRPGFTNWTGRGFFCNFSGEFGRRNMFYATGLPG